VLVLVAVALLVPVLFGGAVVVAVALGRSAARADEAVDAELELIRLTARLTALTEVRSPSGRRFFPTPQARRELAETVLDLRIAA
jgi:hypothetical protein